MQAPIMSAWSVLPLMFPAMVATIVSVNTSRACPMSSHSQIVL